MTRVKIIGAGSIGNHLAYASRSQGWTVFMTDQDPAALMRTKNEIYPARYGAWDNEIMLLSTKEAYDISADLVVIGTPPDSHIPLALQVIEENSPQAILIEKPLCGPDLNECDRLLDLADQKGIFIGVGYNHTLTENTKFASEFLKHNDLGPIKTITARTREHWGGIFAAHPWLDGPKDSYLGYYKRGGGACGEHSHAINLWQYFAYQVGAGRVNEVSATFDMVSDGVVEYDQLCLLSLKTEHGLIGDVCQDVVTSPTEKMARIQGDSGFVEWHASRTANTDELITKTAYEDQKITTINKTRPDDFKGEIQHISDLLNNTHALASSPIALERGLETMLVIAAAFRSHEFKRTIHIDWSKGYNLSALS